MEPGTLISLVGNLLQGHEWSIQAEGHANGFRLDLLATSPEGRMFSFELTTGTGPAHFAALAQAKHTAHDVGVVEQQDVTPVLLTSQDVSDKLKQVAGQVGVEVIEIPEPAQLDKPAVEGIVTDVAGQLFPKG